MLQIDINAGATPKEVGGILSNNGIFVDFQCLRIRIGQLQYVTCLVLNHSYTLVIWSALHNTTDLQPVIYYSTIHS